MVPDSIPLDFSEVSCKDQMMPLCTCIAQKQEYGESAQGHGDDLVSVRGIIISCSLLYVEQRVNDPGSWRCCKT